jgi:hypothetical protein
MILKVQCNRKVCPNGSLCHVYHHQMTAQSHLVYAVTMTASTLEEYFFRRLCSHLKQPQDLQFLCLQSLAWMALQTCGRTNHIPDNRLVQLMTQRNGHPELKIRNRCRSLTQYQSRHEHTYQVTLMSKIKF